MRPSPVECVYNMIHTRTAIALVLLALLCSRQQVHALTSHDYFATGSRLEREGRFLPALLNFQQVLRLKPSESDALQRVESCAKAYTALKNWPSGNKAAVEPIMRELQVIDNDWNRHAIKAQIAHFDDTYVDNDGFDKSTLEEQIVSFWNSYPDSKMSTKIEGIVTDGDFAIVKSSSSVSGHTASVENGTNLGRGKLESTDRKLLILKQVAGYWTIIGQVMETADFLVRFGVGTNVSTTLDGPIRIDEDTTFTASVKQTLPSDTVGVGSITAEILEFPPASPKDAWRTLDDDGGIKRMLTPPTSNKNILLMATVGLTDTDRKALKGLQFLSKRISVARKALGPSVLDVISKGPSIPAL